MFDRLFRNPGVRLTRFAVLAFCGGLIHAQTTPGDQAPLSARERALLDRIERLEKKLEALEARLPAPAPSAPATAVNSTPTIASPVNPQSAEAAKAGVLGLTGTTMNLYFDGYYGWNFNRPVGRVNLLRANDVLSNNFTLNQVGLIMERAPDVAAGRRYGARLDLMFGQNTETLQGGTQNEPRPQVYRHIFQAYGTYVFPVGSGLTVDFGKFYSSLGLENNYAYDEINYSRSFYFNYLPFYHMGFRTTYNINDKLTLQHWLVNGANQSEDFNGFKSSAFLLTVKPSKAVTWNLNYYVGQENRELEPDYNPGIPPLPTEPGLSTTPIPGPLFNGRSHIIDTYLNWNATSKLTVAGEFDYVVSRSFTNSPPSHVIGGVGYLQYHFTPKFSLAGRFEYLSDQGGLFSGVTQDLKEHTITATYQLVDGFQVRLEHRRDFSNTPFFLTETPGILKKAQNTATLGLIWWFGGKRESW
jgi:hypothetical protein